MNTKLLGAALALAGLVAGSAPWAMAQVSQDDLVQRRDKKLASAFLKNGEWHTNYEQALAEAKKTGKLVFGYFTRSYSP